MITTVIIPVGPHHHALADRAIASVHDQTAQAALIVVHDADRKGPGWGRNQGIAQTDTPYVLFLDADDWLTPDAVRQLEAGAAGWDGYVYGDWLIGDAVHKSPDPCRAWRHGTRNIVTALVPTIAARAVGGFDETLPGAEDTDFFLKLIGRGVCGKHIEYPVLNYRPDGKRGREYAESGERLRIHALFDQKYGDVIMGCCGQSEKPKQEPVAIPADAVAVRPVWGGNRGVVGPVTGTNYGRVSNTKVIHVHPADWAMMPKALYTVVDTGPYGGLNPDLPIARGLGEIGDVIFQQQYPAPMGTRYQLPTSGVVAPDLDAVIRMGHEALSASAGPEPAPEPVKPKRKRTRKTAPKAEVIADEDESA